MPGSPGRHLEISCSHYLAAAGANPGSTLADDFKPSRWIFDNGFELGSTVDWSATSAP